ncbi:MAG: 2-oxoacid:acceptor oxidoreductase subunit alpha [Caldisericaceae bacterium]
MVDFSIFLGGQAGEGIKRGALTLGKLFNRFGYYVFVYNDYGSIIRGGQDYSEIRVSEKELHSQSGNFDYMFSFHPDVYERYKDRASLNALTFIEGGGGFDINFSEIARLKEASPFMKSSIVLGIISYIKGIPFEEVENLLRDDLKEKAYKNILLAEQGYEIASELDKKSVIKAPIPIGGKSPLPILSGNESIALGAVRSGMKLYAAYPITPSSTLLDMLAEQARNFEIAVVHAEDEISAISMAIGSAYAGVPSMVGTSGPGIDLFGESISLAGGTEIPIVILDAQRAGPTTGVPTYTEQSDLNLVLNVGHGEFPRIVLAPGDIDEAFEITAKAFQYAFWYQVPVIILSDKHISESFKTSKIPFGNHYITPVKTYDGEGGYKRYEITDDGIPPLAFPGTEGIVNHTNSTEHTDSGYSSSLPQDVKAMKEHRLKKMETIKSDFELEETMHVLGDTESKNVIIGFGGTTGAILEAIEGLPVKFVQIVSLEPFPIQKLRKEIQGAQRIISIEQNSFGQLASLFEAKLLTLVSHKILKYDARPFNPVELANKIKEVIR